MNNDGIKYTPGKYWAVGNRTKDDGKNAGTVVVLAA
jgi:hypothetical protein